MSAKAFDFYGVHLELDEATDHYISIYKDFQNMAAEAETQAQKVFESKFSSYGDFCSSARSVYEDLFNTYLQQTVRKLVSFKIYDIDEEVLLSEVKSDRALGYTSAINDILTSILSIDAAREAKHEENKSLTRSISGSFFGAAADSADSARTAAYYGNSSGMAMATYDASTEAALGITAFAAGSAISAISNYVGKKNDEKEKIRIFESEFNRKNIFDRFREDVFWLNTTFARLVNERAGKGQFFYYTTDDIVAKDNSICRNIIHGNFLHDSIQPNLESEMISRMLADNPYENRIYSYLLVKNGGLSDEMKTVYEYLGLDIASLADIYLEEFRGPISLQSYEEACTFVDEIKTDLDKFGISNCSYYEKAEARKEELYKIRKTFNGFVYDTIEQRDDAEKQFNEFFEEGSAPADTDLNELIAKYYETYNSEIYPQNRKDLQQIIIGFVPERLKPIKTIEELTPYVDDATEKSKEFNDENMSLLKTLESSMKKLKFKTGVFNAAGAVKDKSKELLSKMPFGKKDKGDAAETSADDASADAAQGNPAETAANSAASGAKSLFGKVGGVFSKGKDTSAQVQEPAQAPAPEQKPAQSDTPDTSGASDTKTCPQCGNILNADKKFCGKCGYKF